MTGDHFGKMGLVVFPGVSQPVAALQWSETAIQIVIPNGAAPGKIRLSIFEERLTRCGKDFDIYRPDVLSRIYRRCPADPEPVG